MVNKTDGLTHTMINDTDKIVCSANRIGDSMECAFRHVVRNTEMHASVFALQKCSVTLYACAV